MEVELDFIRFFFVMQTMWVALEMKQLGVHLIKYSGKNRFKKVFKHKIIPLNYIIKHQLNLQLCINFL